MNTEDLELPEWPPLAIGAVILLIGMLLCVIGLCRMVVVGSRMAWKWARGRLKKEPRERG